MVRRGCGNLKFFASIVSNFKLKQYPHVLCIMSPRSNFFLLSKPNLLLLLLIEIFNHHCLSM